MAASASFTLAGLCLGSSLIMLVAAVSDEFNSTSVSQVTGYLDIALLLFNLMRINSFPKFTQIIGVKNGAN